jgi:hypothetical protein
LRFLAGIPLAPGQLPATQRPTAGILPRTKDESEESANDTVAVAAIAAGVGINGRKNSKTGTSMNICRRYAP